MSTKQDDENMNKALKMMGSPRGQYIIGQALEIAVKELSKVEDKLRERSNISDMQFLGESIFKAGYVTHALLSDDLLNKIRTKLGNDPDQLIQDEELINQINSEVADLKNKSSI